MKRKNIILLACLLLLMMAACGTQNENQESNQEQIAAMDIPVPSGSQVSGDTETPILTEVSSLTLTPTLTPSPNANLPSTSSPSPTASPVVEPVVTRMPIPVKEAGENHTRELTTMEVVAEMGYGINLGNTLEACGDWINGKTPSAYETAWGSPVITKDMIQGYADAGFGVLRIPVAWSNLMIDDGNYTIAPEYTARVKEVVDMALDTGMYVILNIHWDSGWFAEFPEKTEECMNRYIRMWVQIAEAFESYGDKLMFESQNEELGWDSIWNPWGGSKKQKEVSYALANEVNQVFVDVIRNSGGQNPWRHLLIAGYNTDIARTCDELFKMPEDPANRMAVSVHYYTPSTLCILDQDASWGKAKTEWGSQTDINELNANMNKLKSRFIDNGIPVIVGEYGCFGSNKAREVIEHWALTVSESMYKIGACPVLWDTPGDEYDRTRAEFRNPEFIQRLLETWKSDSW